MPSSAVSFGDFGRGAKKSVSTTPGTTATRPGGPPSHDLESAANRSDSTHSTSHPRGPWTFEATAGVWLFEDNDDFFGGQHREQDPLASIQAHLGYTFRPRLWLAFNATYYDGGASTINGDGRDDRQSNSRYGLTLSVPLGRSQSLKLHWNDGATTRIGSEFTSYGIAWQYIWLGSAR